MTRQDKQDTEKLIIEKITACSYGISNVSNSIADEHEAVAIYNLVNALDILNHVPITVNLEVEK